MLSQIINFFLNENRAQSDSLIKYRTQFINIIVFVVTVVSFVMSIVRFNNEEYLVSAIDMMIAIITYYMIYLIRVKPHYLKVVIKVFLLLFYFFTFMLIIKVEYEAKLALPFMLLSAALFLQGKRAGLFWFIALVIGLLTVHVVPIFDTKFSNITIIMEIVFLFSHYLVLLIYENQQNESNDQLKKEMDIQKEALDNFKILIDSTVEAVLVFDKELGIVECNKVGLSMFGYTKEQLLGKSILDFVYKDDIKLVQEKMKLDKTDSYEIRGVDHQGKPVPVLVSGADMFYNKKSVRVVTIFDLSELKQKDRLIQLQSRHAVMGEMIGMIAHQWRQPLAAISGSVNSLHLDLMMDTYNKETFQNEITKISDHTQFLSTTIDDFRNFFKEHKQKEHMTLEEIIQSSLTIIESTLESKNIEVIRDFHAYKSLYTHANELKQVVLNLIKNAQDVLLENDIENPMITISTYKKKNKFTLVVSDNGGGIPIDIVDNIFDPYFTTKEKRDGTGLGLYMSKTIIQEHCGGTISVSNSENGAEFKIVLESFDAKNQDTLNR